MTTRAQKVPLVGCERGGDVRAREMLTIVSTRTRTVSPARASPASNLCSPPPGSSGSSVAVSPSCVSAHTNAENTLANASGEAGRGERKRAFWSAVEMRAEMPVCST